MSNSDRSDTKDDPRGHHIPLLPGVCVELWMIIFVIVVLGKAEECVVVMGILLSVNFY